MSGFVYYLPNNVETISFNNNNPHLLMQTTIQFFKSEVPTTEYLWLCIKIR